MNLVPTRFGNLLVSQLFEARIKQRQFQRLLNDRPTGVKIGARTKNPEADLHRQYQTNLGRSALITVTLMVLFYALYPEYHPTVSQGARPVEVLSLSDIPQTQQSKRPPTPRPKVPLSVDGDIVPEDVTIESTELDLDSIPDDLIVGPATPIGPISDEPIDYAEIDYKPHPIRIVTPEYPEPARKKRMEGKVMVKVLVDKEGTVETVEVVDGPEVFRDAALAAARQFRFRPGKHAGERRKVWMVMPIEFMLK